MHSLSPALIVNSYTAKSLSVSRHTRTQANQAVRDAVLTNLRRTINTALAEEVFAIAPHKAGL